MTWEVRTGIFFAFLDPSLRYAPSSTPTPKPRGSPPFARRLSHNPELGRTKRLPLNILFNFARNLGHWRALVSFCCIRWGYVFLGIYYSIIFFFVSSWRGKANFRRIVSART